MNRFPRFVRTVEWKAAASEMPAAKARAKALFYAGGLAMFGAVFQACGLPNDQAETMVAYLGDEVGSLVHKDTTPA